MGAIVGWSGLSVHGQVASIISSTDLRMSAYIKARLLRVIGRFFHSSSDVAAAAGCDYRGGGFHCRGLQSSFPIDHCVLSRCLDSHVWDGLSLVMSKIAVS